jgi:hypothetical protein
MIIDWVFIAHIIIDWLITHIEPTDPHLTSKELYTSWKPQGEEDALIYDCQ